MKSIATAVTTVLFSLNLFAGPEAHKAAQSCYMLQSESHGFIPEEAPREICLEKLSIDTSAKQISVVSYFRPGIFQDLKISKLSQENENAFTFQAGSVLKEVWESGCGEGNRIELILAGQTDSLGEARVDQLQVSVQWESTVDVCHSPVVTESFVYLLY